jgi:phosphoglucomutase
MRTLSIGVNTELYNDILALFGKTYSTIGPAIKDLQAVLTFQPMAASTVKYGEKMGGNVMGIEPEPQAWLDLTTQWSDAADDEVLLSVSHTFISAVAEMAKKQGLLYDFLYLNDAAQDQEVIKSYGKKNVEFLKEVAKKYDPEGVFQKVGGFKLP